MDHIEKYNQAFVDAFDVDADQVETLSFNAIPAWDSVGQMMLVAAIEDAFAIELEPDDIIALNSYDEGKRILHERYGIDW